MGASIFEIEHNGLFYEFEFDSDHKWTHHTKWPDGQNQIQIHKTNHCAQFRILKLPLVCSLLIPSNFFK